MRAALSTVVSAVVLFAAALAQAATFRPVHVYVDSSSQSLAAYQIEITTGDGKCAEIVGVEGGEHSAFHSAPYYDPAALRGGRIVIGAFSTATDLPRGETLVAVLHVLESLPCRYQARALAAASESEDRISIRVRLEPVNGGSND
jgi:hypothetical protein